MMKSPRIVSLIPSATEILDCLGLTHFIVGRSHECDYPEAIKDLPVCTQPKFNPVGTSSEIHHRVSELLEKALSVYQVELETLEKLQPTHILTQAQCEVCACSLTEVQEDVSTFVHSKPEIISLEPNFLAEVWTDIQRVAKVLNVDAEKPILALNSRIQTITNRTLNSLTTIPKVACIEWIDPLMAAGNWIPELVEIAGGNSLFGVAGQHSPWLEWESLITANPDILIFMPCGFDLERTQQEVIPLILSDRWQSLQAVQQHQVYITDGNAYFNRPGPRLVDSLEILAEIIQPESFNFGYEGQGWQRLKG